MTEAEAVASMLPTVRRMAFSRLRTLPASVEADDLIQAGLIGVLSAFRRFDDSHGCAFEAYAATRIHGAMIDELRALDEWTKWSRSLMRKINVSENRLSHELGRAPRDSEISADVGIPEDGIREFNSQFARFESAGEHDFSANPAEQPEARLELRQMCEAVVSASKHMPDRERSVMTLYYEDDQTLREIGSSLGISESRACQIHTDAIDRIRVRVGCHEVRRKADIVDPVSQCDAQAPAWMSEEFADLIR